MGTDSFMREWNMESAKLIDDINSVIEQTGLYGWNLVTAANPVKTGRSRASWLLTVDEEQDQTKPATKSKGRVYADPKPPGLEYDFIKNRRLFISNNVDYIEYLEYGNAFFSPFAMVTRSAPKIEAYLNKQFARLDKKEY